MARGSFLFELRRKGTHVFALLYILLYWLVAKFYGHRFGVIAIGGVLVFFLVLDYFRVLKRKRLPLVQRFYRKSERNRLAGTVYFALGALIVFAFFDFGIASVAMFMAVFGDMAAALIGVRYGKHKVPGAERKSWEGFFAGLVVNIIIGIVGTGDVSIGFAMALVASLAETYLRIDDNLSVPVLAGLAGTFIRFIV